MLHHEEALKKTNDKTGVSRNLLRLVRALGFFEVCLQNIANEEMSLYKAVTSAYKATLHPYHSFMVRTVMKVAFLKLPTREEFYKTLQIDQTVANQMFPEVEGAMRAVRLTLHDFYTTRGLTKLE